MYDLPVLRWVMYRLFWGFYMTSAGLFPLTPPVSFSILSPRNGIGRIIDFSAQQETRKIRWFLLRYISKFFHELHLFFFLFNLMQVLFLSQAWFNGPLFLLTVFNGNHRHCHMKGGKEVLNFYFNVEKYSPKRECAKNTLSDIMSARCKCRDCSGNNCHQNLDTGSVG